MDSTTNTPAPHNFNPLTADREQVAAVFAEWHAESKVVWQATTVNTRQRQEPGAFQVASTRLSAFWELCQMLESCPLLTRDERNLVAQHTGPGSNILERIKYYEHRIARGR